MDHPHTMEAHAAAALVVAGLAVNGKRGRDDDDMVTNDPNKVARLQNQAMAPMMGPARPAAGSTTKVLRPFPYFYYRDFSTVPDPDPLTPVTSPGRVPNFPAKMHSILSRADLADVVAWMPHGRSWRVLKPREFEIRVIPTYFEHAKFSSFIRQANGWGFRRITQGRDRNSYYHEMFLRGLPHLCKMMKRPGVSEKQAADPEQEPDFYKISEDHLVPEKTDDESILLQCTLQGGPKARMPIYFGSLSSSVTPVTSPIAMPQNDMKMSAALPQAGALINQFQPANILTVNTFQPALPTITPDSQMTNINYNNTNNRGSILSQQPQHSMNQQQNMGQQNTIQQNMTQFMPVQAPVNMNMNSFTPQNAAHQAMNVDEPPSPVPNQIAMPPSVAAAFQASTAASQFAAGFAAATALSHQQFRSILGQALASFPNNNQENQQFAQGQPQQSQQQQQQQAQS